MARSAVKVLASNQKVVGSMLESGILSLCSWERLLTRISHRGQAVYQSWWPSRIDYLLTEPQKGVSCVCVVNERKRPNETNKQTTIDGFIFIRTNHCAVDETFQ